MTKTDTTKLDKSVEKRKTMEFHRLAVEIKKWFEDREISTTDTEVGHLALFVQDKLSKQKKELIEELEKLREVDNVVVSKRISKTDNVAEWEGVGESKEALFGWSEALDQAIKTIKNM